MKKKLRIKVGTRGSRLALWQSEWVAECLRRVHEGLEVDLVEIRTHGDRDRNSPLAAIGGMGLFTKEIQRALVEGEVDLAVHSLKDLPTASVSGLMLGAVPAREAVADALIAPRHGGLEALPAGAKVGTSSLRRKAMLLYERPDLRVENLRGNIETRLKAAVEGPFDAVVLAEAGLSRLGLESHISERLGPPRFLPAVGQGALGIECRAEDHRTRELLLPLSDEATRVAVLAERTLLAALHGGCVVPIGAWGRGDDLGGLRLDAVVYDAVARRRVSAQGEGSVERPEELGNEVARKLVELGALELLAAGPRGE